MRKSLLIATFLLCAAPAGAQELKIISVDVEGGAAVLMRTPAGKSLLIDTGWAPGQGGGQGLTPGEAPKNEPSSAERIFQAAHSLGITHLDYLVMTHYHADHLGGLESVLALLPADTFVDHGPNRETLPPDADVRRSANAPQTRYPAWLAAAKGHSHISVSAGDVLNVGALHIRFVASDGRVLKAALPGAGRANPACAHVPPPPRVGGEENDRSLGLLMRFGRTRIVDLGDLTWNKEIALLCPANKMGRADIYFVTGHGMDLSNSPPTAAIDPLVAIMQNGPTKGGSPDVVKTVESYPHLQGFWRTHAMVRNPELDGDPNYIANLRGGADGNPIRLSITETGQITVTNSRNGFSRTYMARGAP
ncbi:MAG: MBL fold metallo-hydrolase [Alphaproteobacteria bacterium]|nr:MBL fold metallo-hydrolase [Alphaproteobacteria bacterium]